jgi:P27 family predicted phage terminase small subunit
MPGPRPTPIPLRLLRGNPGKRPIGAHIEPERPAEPPEPPPFLAKHAQDEWWRVAPGLHQMGLLTVLDVMPLAAYCMAYARWRAAEEGLARTAEFSPRTSGLLIRTMDGNARANPLARIAAAAAADMVRYAAEFGFSPAARARIAAGPFADPPSGGKFDGLLK